MEPGSRTGRPASLRRKSTAMEASQASAPPTPTCALTPSPARRTIVNFRGGDPLYWVIGYGTDLCQSESAQFYPPVIADPSPAAGRHHFPGFEQRLAHPGLGRQSGFPGGQLSRVHHFGANPTCGDFVQIGPAGATSLTASAADYRGTTRSGGNVAAIRVPRANTGTMWAATTTGRVFISTNADNPTASAVVYARLDSMPSATASPGRFVSGIYIDPREARTMPGSRIRATAHSIRLLLVTCSR